MVKTRWDAGNYVDLVDMRTLLDTQTDYFNDSHPNVVRFAKLVKAWYITFNAVAELGWISDPVTDTGFHDVIMQDINHELIDKLCRRCGMGVVLEGCSVDYIVLARFRGSGWIGWDMIAS